jgi:hypothetical protein
MRESDQHYFTRRAAEERAAAERADSPEAERTHLELAQRYDVAAAVSSRRGVVQLRVGATGGSGRRA